MSLINTLKFIINHPLNRKNRRQALTRYLKWQVGSRVLPWPTIVEWVGGARAIARPGETGFTQNIYCGLQDFTEMAYLLHSITEADLFADVGANVGAYTILACAVKHARGYCFEPVPSTFARLTDNLLINKLLTRVTALNLGISDREGELCFTTSAGPMNRVAGPGDEGQRTLGVPVRTLDQVLAGQVPSVLKIDVEGFEAAVLNGATATLSDPVLHSILIELNGSGLRYGFDEHDIVRKLNSFGFSGYHYDPFSRSLTPLNFKDETGDNTLFVRDAVSMQQRLQRAPRMTVHSVEF